MTSSNEVPRAILCSAAKSRTVSGSSVTPRTKRIGAPKSRAAFTRVLPHQPRPTIAVLSMMIRLRRRGRARLLEGVSARESVVLGAGGGDAGHRRVRRQIDLEEVCARHLTGKANVGNGDLFALAIGASFFLSRQMLFQSGKRRLVPVLGPFLHARFIDLKSVSYTHLRAHETR